MPRPRSLAVVAVLLCLQLVPGVLPVAAAAVPPAGGAAPPPAVGDHLWLGPDGAPLPFADDDDALEFLRVAEVVAAEEIHGSLNKPLKVLLEHDGVRAHAVFRRVNRVWNRQWVGRTFRLHLFDRASSERAAYVLARLLGFDNIPPTVLREIDGRRGSLQLWIEGAERLGALAARHGALPEGFTEQMVAIAAFDNLVFNVDRHPGNILVGPDGRLWMIDHTQAFQYDRKLLDAERLRIVPATMWERLTVLADDEIAAALDEALNDNQVEALLARRARLVERITALIGELGGQRVLLAARGQP